MPVPQYKIDTASDTRTPTRLNVLTRSDMKNDGKHAASVPSQPLEKKARKKEARDELQICDYDERQEQG